MPKDNLVRFCLLSIVVLLALIAWRVRPSSNVFAAESEQYLVTDGGGNTQKPQSDQLNAMRAKGWKLVYVGWGTSGLLVWSK